MGGGGRDNGGDDQDQEVPVGSVCRSPILVGRTSVSSVVGVGHTSRHGSPVRVPWLRRQSHPPAQGDHRIWWKLPFLETAEPTVIGLQKRLLVCSSLGRRLVGGATGGMAPACGLGRGLLPC